MSLPPRAVATTIVLCVLAPFALSAPSATVAPDADTSVLRRHPSTISWPQRGWISAGVGSGTSPYGSLAAIAAG